MKPLWRRSRGGPPPAPSWTRLTTQSLWLTGGATGFVLSERYRGHAIERMSPVQLADTLQSFEADDPVSAALMRRWLRQFRTDIADDIIEDAEAGDLEGVMTPAQARLCLGVSPWADAREIRVTRASQVAQAEATGSALSRAEKAQMVLLRLVRHR